MPWSTKTKIAQPDWAGKTKIAQEGKDEEWLLEQEKKWRCPECGNPIILSYDFKDCHWCKNKLRD